MNRKLMLIIIGALAITASLIIAIAIDPSSAQRTTKLVQFQRNNEHVYIDGYFKDDLLPKITNEDYKVKLEENITKMSAIVNVIDKNLITDIQSASATVLEEKTMKALAEIKKLLVIVNQVEKNMPEDVKSVYNGEAAKKLRNLYNIVPTGGAGSKSMVRFLLIFLLAIISGVVFIMIESKARKTGEIKSSEIA